MTTMTAPPRTPTTDGVTFRRVVASEWIKFRSLRSTFWTLGSAMVLMAAVSLLAAWGLSSIPEGEGGMPGMSVGSVATTGVYLGQLAVAVLGVLIITGEYSTGMIRSTLAASPRRLAPLGAKALVIAVVVAIIGLMGVVLSYLATLPFHDELGVTLDLADRGELRILLGTPLYLAACALLALGVGAVLRHSAGALAAVVGLMLVVEPVLQAIPFSWSQTIAAFLPSNAGSRLLMNDETLAMMAEVSSGPQMSPWQGFGVLLLWIAVLFTLAVVLLRRRDA